MGLLIIGTRKKTLKRVLGQILLLLEKRKEPPPNAIGLETLRGDIEMRESKIMKDLKRNADIEKRRIAIEIIVEKNVIQLTRMIGTGGRPHQDLEAGPGLFQKMITGPGQGMSNMGRGDVLHQSNK